MEIRLHAPLLDTILDHWRAPLAGDFAAYRNHCCRVLNFCLALNGDRPDAMDKFSIAVAFHDLGIWTDHTYDYLAPSKRITREYLAQTSHADWLEEIQAMIEYHHKLTTYRSNPGSLVEPFRQADWIDITKGALTFGLPRPFVTEVLSLFPNAGFHRRLVALTLQRMKTHPFNPLPMMRL